MYSKGNTKMLDFPNILSSNVRKKSSDSIFGSKGENTRKRFDDQEE